MFQSKDKDGQPDYASITETPGLKATGEQVSRLYHRYRFALDFVRGKEAVEVACGTGIGLGLLAGQAARIEAGDIDQKNLSIATKIYRDTNINIRYIDAHALPFQDNSFDAVLLFEAVYYLGSPTKFIAEACRILRKKGTLIMCTVNKDWEDFHPSPFANEYFNVPQLSQLVRKSFRNVQCYGAFPAHPSGTAEKIFSLTKRTAIALRLIPGSLAGRAYLKRIFIGPLQPLPERLDLGTLPYAPPVSISSDYPNRDYKIIYAVSVKD